MRILLALIGLLALANQAGAAEPGVKAKIVGTTLAAMPAKSTARIDFSGPDELILHCDKQVVRIPYGKVHTLEYGQNVSRRYAAAVLISPVLLLSKSRKHYVTIGFVDSQEKQHALVLKVDKSNVRGVLAGLEARTGRRVEYQDQEARKSKG